MGAKWNKPTCCCSFQPSTDDISLRRGEKNTGSNHERSQFLASEVDESDYDPDVENEGDTGTGDTFEITSEQSVYPVQAMKATSYPMASNVSQPLVQPLVPYHPYSYSMDPVTSPLVSPLTAYSPLSPLSSMGPLVQLQSARSLNSNYSIHSMQCLREDEPANDRLSAHHRALSLPDALQDTATMAIVMDLEPLAVTSPNLTNFLSPKSDNGSNMCRHPQSTSWRAEDLDHLQLEMEQQLIKLKRAQSDKPMASGIHNSMRTYSNGMSNIDWHSLNMEMNQMQRQMEHLASQTSGSMQQYMQ